MEVIYWIRNWLANLFRPKGMHDDLREEMEHHLSMTIEKKVSEGMNPADAKKAALKEFGAMERIKEECRDAWGTRVAADLIRDIRYGFGCLRKTPAFSSMVIATLALGIGANVIVFSISDAAFFEPLGFDSEDQLVWVRAVNRDTGEIDNRISRREFEALRNSGQSFESVSAVGAPSAIWERGDGVEYVPVIRVTYDLGKTLSITPLLGRMFESSDTKEGALPVVLIGCELWESRYGGTSDVLGKKVLLDKQSYTIVGVLPRGLEFPLERAPAIGTGSQIVAGVQAFWLPQKINAVDSDSSGWRSFLVLGRLKSGVTKGAASAELAILADRLSMDYPDTNRGWHFEVEGMRDQILGRAGQGIPVLVGAVTAVLLICCVNLANLLLARGAARQKEMAVRSALGAGRGRMAQVVVAESIVLSVLGGVFGVVLAYGALYGILAFASLNVPFIQEARISGRALVFSVGLSVATAILVGLAPALRESRVNVGEALRVGGRATGGRRTRRWQQGLLIGQVAIVFALLFSGVLLLQSFRRIINQDIGYNPNSVIAMDVITLNDSSYKERLVLYRAMKSKLEELPAVESVGTIQSTPLTGKWTFKEKTGVYGHSISLADQPSLAGTFVAFDYFQTMGVRLVSGRVFRENELQGGEYAPVVVINESAAARLFPGETALGKKISFGYRPKRYYEVIGVVGDTRDTRLDRVPDPRFYLNAAHGAAQFLIQASDTSSVMTALIRESLKPFLGSILIYDIQPLGSIVSASVAERRFLMGMVVVYAALSFLVAIVGVFGVAAYQVEQRATEFGIRLSLGMKPSALLGSVLLRLGRLVMMGLSVGLVLALAAGRFLASQLYEVSPYDPYLLGIVGFLLLLVPLAACCGPAWRAARVEPALALRAD